MPRLRGDSWYVDVTPPGYHSRIVRSTYQADKKLADDYERTLCQLATGGRGDLLDALVDGTVSLTSLHGHFIRGKLNDLELGDRPLRDAVLEFADVETHPNAWQSMKYVLQVAPAGVRLSWLLQARNLRQILAHLRGVGLSGSTEHTYMAYVSKLLAIEFGPEKQRAAFAQIKIRPIEPRVRHLSPEEVARIAEKADAIAAESKSAGDIWPIIALSLATGIRKGEMLDLDVSQLDLDEGLVHVRRGKSERARRTVPIAADEVVALLRGYVARHNRTGAIYPFHTTTLKYYWSRVREDAKLEGVVWHDLRRTFGVNCARAGVPLPDLKKWMGHSSIETTIKHYGQYIPERDRPELKRAVEAMGFDATTKRHLRVAGQ